MRVRCKSYNDPPHTSINPNCRYTTSYMGASVILLSKVPWYDIYFPLVWDAVINSDQVLGHESAGIVSKGEFTMSLTGPMSDLITTSAVGKKVKTHKVGDRVAMEPGATCLVCDACKSGKYNASLRTILRHSDIKHRHCNSYARISFSQLPHPMTVPWDATTGSRPTTRTIFPIT